MITIEDKDGKVFMDLGLIMVTMSPEEADEMAGTLIWHATLARTGEVTE